MYAYPCIRKKTNCVKQVEQSSAYKEFFLTVFLVTSIRTDCAIEHINVTQRVECRVSLARYFRVVGHASFFLWLPQTSSYCVPGNDKTFYRTKNEVLH